MPAELCPDTGQAVDSCGCTWCVAYRRSQEEIGKRPEDMLEEVLQHTMCQGMGTEEAMNCLRQIHGAIQEWLNPGPADTAEQLGSHYVKVEPSPGAAIIPED